MSRDNPDELSSSISNMMPSQLAETLQPFILHLISMAQESQRPHKFVLYIKEALAHNNINPVKATAAFLYRGDLTLASARTVYNELCREMLQLHTDLFLDIAIFLFNLHSTPDNRRALSFELYLADIRDRASVEWEARGEWLRAAEELSKVPHETLATQPMSLVMIKHNLRVAKLFIAANEHEKAETYMNRASLQLANCRNEPLRAQFRMCQAKTLDARGKFEDAAIKYYSLSQQPPNAQQSDLMTDWDYGNTLIDAVTCAILAPAGPRRSRLLAMLYNDDRSRRLDVFPLLERIHMGRLLQKEQLEKFRPTLRPHQLQLLPDGDSVLDRAVIEHNMLAISRLFSNISFIELGALLNISSGKAETTAARMISEKRMNALIDQVEKILDFIPGADGQKIEKWDAQIATLCSSVDDCIDAILGNYPDFARHLEA